MVFYSNKMILAKNWYKSKNNNLQPIIRFFKTWQYYPKSFRYNVLVFINNNNLHLILNTKNFILNRYNELKNYLNTYFYSTIAK